MVIRMWIVVFILTIIIALAFVVRIEPVQNLINGQESDVMSIYIGKEVKYDVDIIISPYKTTIADMIRFDLGYHSIHIYGAVVIFDNANVSPDLEFIHILRRRRLLTIAFEMEKSMLLVKSNIDIVNASITKLQSMYDSNSIILYADNVHAMDSAQQYENMYLYGDFTSTSIGCFEMSLTNDATRTLPVPEVVVDEIPPRPTYEEPSAPEYVSLTLPPPTHTPSVYNPIELINDDSQFGFYDKQSNVTFIKNRNRQNKFKAFVSQLLP